MRISDEQLQEWIVNGHSDPELASMLDLRDAREAIQELLKWDWEYMIAEQELAFDDVGKKQFSDDIDRLRNCVEVKS